MMARLLPTGASESNGVGESMRWNIIGTPKTRKARLNGAINV